jgi:WhiB family redox-sensing transcriptional regulator
LVCAEFADMEALARLMERAMEAPEPWQVRALCAQTDPEAFFPGQGEPTAAAKAVCMRCPVRGECLAYALERDEHGVWGGLSERERRALRRARRAESAPVAEPVEPEGGEAA